MGEHGLVLGNASIRFRHLARKVLFPKLMNLAQGLFMTKDHALGYYNLLLLLTLEFSSSGINDVLILAVELEDIALNESGLSLIQRNFLHSCVAGCLHIVSLLSDNDDLVAHLEGVLKRRRASAQQLLPEKALKEVSASESAPVSFQMSEEGEETSGGDPVVDERVYFKLVENGFIIRPNELARNSSEDEIVLFSCIQIFCQALLEILIIIIPAHFDLILLITVKIR